MLLEALRHGFRKVSIDVPADNAPAATMFQRLGFEPEALLRDQLMDGSGQLRDVLLLTHLVDDQWSGIALAGVEEELG